MSENILNWIRCPLCEASLAFQAEKVSCGECQYETFFIGGIPWVFADPQASLAEWQNRFSHHCQSISREIAEIEVGLNEGSLLSSTRQRLRNLKKAKQKQNKHLKELMEPLQLSTEDRPEIFSAMKTVLPMSQRLMSYEANVFRDWTWGDEENQASLDLLSEVLERAGAEFSELLVVGAGSCRLPLDLHHRLRLQSTLALDINPFLLLLAKKVIAGETVGLVDFPLAPKSAACVAVESQLRSPYAETEGFQYVLADALDLNVHSAAVEAVLTPWFIDIIPQDIDIFFRQLNRILPVGGHWLNFGTFAFHHKDPQICYSKEELLEVAAAAGFDIVAQAEREIPYLNSPHSGHRRRENVLAFCAKKAKEVDEYEDCGYLPEWITDSSKSIPSLELFKSYVFINQIQFEVLRAVDGRISIAAISSGIAEKYKMKTEQAEQAVRGFFTKIYEENLFQGL